MLKSKYKIIFRAESKTDRLAFGLFLLSICILFFTCGVIVGSLQVWPKNILEFAMKGGQEILTISSVSKKLPYFYKRINGPCGAPVKNPGGACEGINLITEVSANRELSAKLIDLDGNIIHKWAIDWFKMWPNADHIPSQLKPRSRPGTQISGAIVMDNGDLVFCFNRLGLLRIDIEGKVIWRLPYLTHHSIHRYGNGNILACGKRLHKKPIRRLPNRKAPFFEQTILEVSPDGKILQEWSIPDLLIKNGLHGLLYLGTLSNSDMMVTGDLLHLNDVEPFPKFMIEDFFEIGDILVSLRNINTIFVFNRKSNEVKFICSGMFIRQHDPDFISGNAISLFDNNTNPPKYNPQSRILIISAPEKLVEVAFEGNHESAFYTATMGRHQWLKNGNILVTESKKGRAFEVNSNGTVVWEYINYVAPGIVGQIDAVDRIPLEYSSFYQRSRYSKSEPKRNL